MTVTSQSDFPLELILLIVLLSTFTGFVVVVAILFNARRRAAATRSWSQTTGRIRAVNLESRHAGSRNRITFFPQVIYDYEVAGRPLEGRWVHRDDHSGYTRRGLAEKVLQPYVASALVPVFYDPENPSESVLSNEPSPRHQNFVIAAVILLISAIADILILGFLLPYMLTAFSSA